MEFHQEKNPNNSRIFIDYRKNKDKVVFERVGRDTYFKIALITLFNFSSRTGLIVLPIFSIFIIPINYYSPIAQIARLIVFIDSLIVFFIGGALILSKTRLLKYLPKLNSFAEKKYSLEVKPEDIKNKRFELPLFRNIQLFYKASGDIGEKLYRVEIVEHPFNLLLKKGKIKKFPQEYLWKAIFLFLKQPKNGLLQVYFK